MYFLLVVASLIIIVCTSAIVCLVSKDEHSESIYLCQGRSATACGCCSHKQTPVDSCCTVIVITFFHVKYAEADVFQKLVSYFCAKIHLW